MGAKIRKDDTVVMTFCGDGATSSNDFHSGLNFAGVYKAPCVFVAENNQWAISAPLEKQTASETIASKAAAYGMPGMRVDGNDILAVYTATNEARERALAGGGPTLLELVTFRLAGHSSSDDPSRYISEATRTEWEKKDPIDRFRTYLENKGLWDSDKHEELRGACREEVNQAIKDNERVARPELESIFTDVYKDMPEDLRRDLEREQQARGEGKFP